MEAGQRQSGTRGAYGLLPEEEWGDLKKLDMCGVTEFKRGANGVIELKFVDRGKLLERLLDAVDASGEEQVERFLRAMEGREE